MTYIAYKYTHSPNKVQLRQDLETIAQVFETKHYKTFVLFRDKKKWGEAAHKNKLHSAIFMLYKLIFAERVVAFVDSDQPSPGLDFEIKYARLLGKPITLLIKKSIKEPKLRQAATHLIEFDNHRQLKQLQLQPSLSLRLAAQKA